MMIVYSILDEFLYSSRKVKNVDELLLVLEGVLTDTGIVQTTIALPGGDILAKLNTSLKAIKVCSTMVMKHYFYCCDASRYILNDTSYAGVSLLKKEYFRDDKNNSALLKKYLMTVHQRAIQHGPYVSVCGLGELSALLSFGKISKEEFIHEGVLDLAYLILVQFYKCYYAFLKQENIQPFYHLTPKEKDILRCAAQGLTKVETADKMFISRHSVDDHIQNIFIKLKCEGMNEAVDIVLNRCVI